MRSTETPSAVAGIFRKIVSYRTAQLPLAGVISPLGPQAHGVSDDCGLGGQIMQLNPILPTVQVRAAAVVLALVSAMSRIPVIAKPMGWAVQVRPVFGAPAA